MKRFLILILCVLTASTAGTFAQGDIRGIDISGETRPFFFGITAGYNRSMHTAELPSIEQDLCPTFPSGTDNGFWAGITYEEFFGDLASSNQSLIVRAIYSTYPSITNVGGEEYPTRQVQYNPDGTIAGDKYVYSATEHNLAVEYSVASLELAYKIKPIRGFDLGVTIGPTFDYALAKNWDQSFDLIKPLNAQFKHDAESEAALKAENPDAYFSDDYRSIILHEGEIEESADLRIGLKVGLQYEYNIKGTQMYIVPAIYYNMGLTNLQSGGDNDWRVNALQMGIDLRRSFRFKIK